MSGEPDDLEKLLESVADGETIDWDEREKAALDEEARAILSKLRLIAEVAEVHRSHVDDQATTPGAANDESTGPNSRKPLPRLPHESHARSDGSTWGHLRLVRKIGEGSYGEVYHAHDTWLDHPVALKLLKSGVESRVPQSGLLHEARKLVRVRHPNVVAVHGADRHNGRVGFWMDLIDGETLATRVERGRLSAGEATDIAQEVCKALAAIHRAGLIHRDIKAQNVMRAHDGGRIVVMDFGAGQFVDEPVMERRAQGTPLYLAPELFRNESASVESDIYATGVLLYHLVTGRFPVEALSLSALSEAHARRERRRLRDERPDLPEAFIAVVERALEPDADRRFASAGAMHDALSSERSGGALHQAPVTAREARELPMWQRRLALAVAVAAAAFAGITLVGGITSTFYRVGFGLSGASLGESRLDWPLWGLRALLAPAILAGSVLSAGLVLVSGAYNLVVPRLSRVRRLAGPLADVSGLAEHVRKSGTATTAALLFLTQFAVVALTMWWFGELLGALDSLIVQTPGGSLSPLSPANLTVQRHFREAFSIEFLAYSVAWAWLLRTKFLTEQSGGWVSICGGIALTFLTLILLVVPFRIFSHNEHERVTFGTDTCYLLVAQGSEALLFCPLDAPPRNRLVKLDDPALKRGGPTENMFTPLGSGVN